MSFTDKKLTLTKTTPYINIYAVTEPKRMDFIGTSYAAVTKTIRELWGDFPCRLEAKDLPVIKGIAIALAENGTAWKQIYEYLDKYGKIELQLDQE
jgi:hypothetical protein